MKFITHLLVLFFALFCLAVAFNLVSNTSDASTCIPYKNGNGSHLSYGHHTYSYDHIGPVAKTDIIMSGTCPTDGIPVTQQTTSPVSTMSNTTSQAIDTDKQEDNEHSKKTHHVVAKDGANVIQTTNVNQTTNVYNSYTTNNAPTQQIDTNTLQVNEQYPVGLYELQRFSVDEYCLGSHCYVIDHCSIIVIQVNQDSIVCLN